jgi:hypothetical protein
MNCRTLEPLVALYVENDLPEWERTLVEEHLRGCFECEILVSALHATQQALRTLRAQAPDSATLKAVRDRASTEIATLENSFRWIALQYLFGSGRRRVATVCILLFLGGSTALWWSRAASITEELPVFAASPLPVPALTEAPAVAQIEQPPRRTAMAADQTAKPPATAQPKVHANPDQIVVQLLVDDPDILIYWLIDERGE